MSNTITYDLSPFGGPERITAPELTCLAARAKARVKASPRGWSLLSQVEIIALAWAVDLFLEDGELPPPPPAQPEPTVISHV